MDEVRLNCLLMGKTGQGKSATGNTILNKRVFETSANTTSKTKDVKSSFSQFGKYAILMVDGPGLEDTAMNKAEDKIAAAKHMDISLAMCYGGVDAFLFVVKFGNRFTEEDKKALEALKKIFGDKFMKHVIVVVTCGDSFQGAMEEENCNKSFHDWCREQDGVFIELYEKCEGRFVLFNNREKDEGRKGAQIQEIVKLAEDLQKHHGRYTSQCFENASYEREKLILELRAPELKEEIQKHICFLAAEIEDLCTRPSDQAFEAVRNRVHKLRSEIEKEDRGYNLLKELKDKVDQVEEHLGDVVKLTALAKDLEEIRAAKKTWGIIGPICAAAAGAMALVIAPVALAAAAGTLAAGGVSAAVSGLSYLLLSKKESDSEKEKKKIEDKRK